MIQAIALGTVQFRTTMPSELSNVLKADVDSNQTLQQSWQLLANKILTRLLAYS
jgi:hypothetical protein